MRQRGFFGSHAAGVVLLSALALGAGGCLSVQKELQKEDLRRKADWERRLNEPRPRPTQTLTWEDALHRLRQGNDKIRSADLDCQRADENLLQIRRSLIPLLSLQGGYNRALTGSTDIDPFTFAASAFFDVPGMIGYTLRREGAQLMIIRARLAREAIWREQVVDLYRQFYGHAQLEAEFASLDHAAPHLSEAGAEAFRADAERRRLAATASLSEVSAELAELIGEPGAVFACRPEGLPLLGYASPDAVPPAAELARLPLRLAAVELVGMRARELGADLQFWPELNFYVNSPALYSRRSGEDTFWSSRDIFAGVNSYWTVDTRGRRASQKRLLVAEIAMRREALDREAARLATRIENALDALRDINTRRAALPSSAGAPMLDQALLARHEALSAEQREWELVLWFFDDARWSGVPEPVLSL